MRMGMGWVGVCLLVHRKCLGKGGEHVPATPPPKLRLHKTYGYHNYERIQWKAACFCMYTELQQTASVTYMLKELNWDTLETRRKKARLTLVYKLSHKLININTDSHLIPHPKTQTRGSHPRKYFIPRASKDIFKFSFFPGTINEWNSPKESYFELSWCFQVSTIILCLILCF